MTHPCDDVTDRQAIAHSTLSIYAYILLCTKNCIVQYVLYDKARGRFYESNPASDSKKCGSMAHIFTSWSPFISGPFYIYVKFSNMQPIRASWPKPQFPLKWWSTRAQIFAIAPIPSFHTENVPPTAIKFGKRTQHRQVMNNSDQAYSYPREWVLETLIFHTCYLHAQPIWPRKTLFGRMTNKDQATHPLNVAGSKGCCKRYTL